MSNSTEKPTPAKPKGPDRAEKSRSTADPVPPLAGVCMLKSPSLVQFLWELLQPHMPALLQPPPHPCPAEPRLSTQAGTGTFHPRDAGMNNAAMGETLVQPQRIFCVLKANLSCVRRRRRPCCEG